MTDIANETFFSEDHTYPAPSFFHASQLPMTTVTNQRGWNENIRNRVTRAINRMCCEDTEYIEGIKVQRTENNRKQSFMVNNDRNTYGKECLKRYSFDEAVTRILELVAEREGCKICKT